MKQITVSVRGKISIVLTILFVALFLLMPSGQAVAQDTIQVIEQEWSADFRDHITFRLQAESPAEFVEVDLLYRIVGRPATSRNEAEFEPGPTIEAEFVLDQTRPENYLPPGTELEYWWKLLDAEGNELTTEKETLLYLDDRYDWQTLENDRLTLYWYEGGQQFGEALFNRANEALDILETDMGITLTDPIKIFIYANHNDLLGAISTSSQEWTGGQAFPNYGVVVLGVQPSQLNWGLAATTHEMTHLVVHQATDNPYGDLPRWLDEGIAVYNENPEQLDEDFRPIFERAVAENELMTLRTLSSPFPADPLEANLAYGQSGAVVQFILDEYGPEAMADLLDIFSEGALYDEALEQALGVDTDALDNQFRLSLDLPPLPGTAVDESVAVGDPQEDPDLAEVESSAGQETDAADTVAVEESGLSAGGAAEEPAGAEAEPGNTPAEEENGGLSALPCLAGLLPLLALGFVVLRRGGTYS